MSFLRFVGTTMDRPIQQSPNHSRAAVFLLPAMFAPTSHLRILFHRLRGAVIGDLCEIGYEVFIDNLYPEKVIIGRQVTIAARATILAHDEARAYAWGEDEVVKTTRIGNGAFVGVSVVVLPGITIGDRAIVGAGSVVTNDVPPDTMVAGVPAKPIRVRGPSPKPWDATSG